MPLSAPDSSSAESLPCGFVSLPDNAQSFERQELIHMLDVLRPFADHRSKAAGREHSRLCAQLREQQFEDAIHQSEISVIKTRLQAAHGVRCRSPAQACEFPRAAGAPCVQTAHPPKCRCPGKSRRPDIRPSPTRNRTSWPCRNPRSRTGPPYFSNAATAFTMRSAPTSAGLS